MSPHDVLLSIEVYHQPSIDYKLLLQGKFVLVFVNKVFVRIFDPASYGRRCLRDTFVPQDNIV